MLLNDTELVPRNRFIAAMRQVATSVSVVTTDGNAGRSGATVSAFSSVSADPPTVLVCLFAESRIAQMVKANGTFCVNVLSENDADIADRFAGRHDQWIEDRFSGITCHGGPGLAPRIEGATTFRCILQQTFRSGSHMIMVGHVRDVLEGNASPLTYRAGQYHRVMPHAKCAISAAT